LISLKTYGYEGVEDRDDERPLLVAVDDLPEHVGGLVAVERRAEHLELVVRLEVRPRLADRFQQASEVAVEVGERHGPAEVGEDPGEAVAKAALAGVIAAVDRRFGLDLLRRDRRANEDQVVVRVGAAEDPRNDGVEERLGEFGLTVVDEEPDEAELHLAPIGRVE